MCNCESWRRQREPCIIVNIQSIWNSSFAPFCWLCRNRSSSSFHMSSAAQWRDLSLLLGLIIWLKKCFHQSVTARVSLSSSFYSLVKVWKNQVSILCYKSVLLGDRGGKNKNKAWGAKQQADDTAHIPFCLDRRLNEWGRISQRVFGWIRLKETAVFHCLSPAFLALADIRARRTTICDNHLNSACGFSTLENAISAPKDFASHFRETAAERVGVKADS